MLTFQVKKPFLRQHGYRDHILGCCAVNLVLSISTMPESLGAHSLLRKRKENQRAECWNRGIQDREWKLVGIICGLLVMESLTKIVVTIICHSIFHLTASIHFV